MKRFNLSPKANQIITYIFYILFAGITIYQASQAEKTSYKIMYLILLILILGIALYSEYLKHLYRKAIQSIAYELDPEKAKQEFDTLLHKDFVKAYQKDKIVFDTLYYIDQKQYQECLEHLENNYKFFHASLDQLLMYHYNKFYCSFMLNDLQSAKDEYNKILRMKNSKTKGMKASPLYNWEFMEAVYQFARKEYKQSYNVFKTVNTQNMNPREIVQHYYQFGRLCDKLKDKNQKENCLNEIKKLNGTSKTCKEGL